MWRRPLCHTRRTRRALGRRRPGEASAATPPYPQRSEATRTYRDAHDLGVKHIGTLSGQEVARYQAGLKPGSPDQRGYRDGVTAVWVRLQELEKFGREQAQRDLAEAMEERRCVVQQERHYRPLARWSSTP